MKKPHIITGQGPLITPKMMPSGSEECVELLEQMLESARQGEMSWLIVVAGGPSDYGHAIVGNDAPKMNLGLDDAKLDILERVRSNRKVR